MAHKCLDNQGHTVYAYRYSLLLCHQWCYEYIKTMHKAAVIKQIFHNLLSHDTNASGNLCTYTIGDVKKL